MGPQIVIFIQALTSVMNLLPWRRYTGHHLCILTIIHFSITFAFLQPHGGIGVPNSLGPRSSAAATWSTWSTSTSLSARRSGCGAEQRLSLVWCRGDSRHIVADTFLRGKKTKRGKSRLQGDSSNWYDDEEATDLQVDEQREARAESIATSSTTPPVEVSTSAVATTAASITDGDLHLSADEDDNIVDIYEAGDDDASLVLEPVWVEGETEEETPIVERYGLNAALGTSYDSIISDLPYDGATSTSSAADVANLFSAFGGGGSSVSRSSSGGLMDGVSQEGTWTGDMEFPEGFADGEGRVMRRDFDDMLMERSIRFYDPKVTGDREGCYLVGLEASGWSAGGAKGVQGAFPERPVNARENIDGDGRNEDVDGWDEEQEAAFLTQKQEAYEARKEERDMRFSLEESMAELSELAGTAGLEVCGSTYQRVLQPNPRTYIGTGKVREIKSAMNQLNVCTVIFDDELSPGQQRNLEVEFGGEAAGIKVLDRTALILDIFAQHARTREGQLQVELALHMYRLPRLTKMWTHLERQQGGVGLRGPGERQLEVDRRLLKDKIIDLKKELSGVRRHRDLQRRGRRKLGLPVVALVGYTNAGKSTLLNTLTRAGVMAENMLFATLDPTTRKVKLTGLKVHPEVMLTDTVGFIQKLPTNLVAAFRATLEEVVEADVIVHIVDASSPSREKQESAVGHVLKEMGVADKPCLALWNKVDLLSEEEQGRVKADAGSRGSLTVSASAKTGQGLDDFVVCLEEAICALLYKVEAVVPYSRGDLLSRVHELGACDTEDFTDAGTHIKARVPRELLNRLEPYFTAEFKERFEMDEMADAGDDEEAAAARVEEMNWKLIAKKRVHANANANATATAVDGVTL